MEAPYSITGKIRYTSNKKEREGQERGRENFRIDIHADGRRTISAHSEIDDSPMVVRDVVSSLNSDGLPTDCFTRISVGEEFRGSGWFRFEGNVAECEAMTQIEGRVSQRMTYAEPVRAFGNHAMINDGFLMRLYDRSSGEAVQTVKNLPLSSPDHRGATGPMLFNVDVAIEFVDEERIKVAAGEFDALHFRLVDVPGLPEEHPEYDLWCTNDGHYTLLRAIVGGYMQTHYELSEYKVVPVGRPAE